MPRCIKSSNRYYTGNEPSPKGLGYCASDEKEGKVMKGRDGNMWIIKNGKWIKDNTKTIKDIVKDDEYYEIKLGEKLYSWWLKLSQGNIILIYKNGENELVTSSMKTFKAQVKDITKKWQEAQKDNSVEAIIWSAQSTDAIEGFVDYIIENNTKAKLEKMVKMKDLPSYLLKNYDEYFYEYEFNGKKDYTLESGW